jgi:hypothetical protein
MPRFVKLLSTPVLEDELLLLHACAMLSQVKAAAISLLVLFFTISSIAPLYRSSFIHIFIRSTPKIISKWCVTAFFPKSSRCCGRP